MYLFQKNKRKNIGSDWSEHVKFYIAGWFFAAILFYIMRQVGVSGLADRNFSILQSLLAIPVFAIVFGIIFGTLLYLFEKYLFRKIPLWKLMLRLITAQLLIVGICVAVYYSITKLMKLNTHAFWDFVQSPATFIFSLYVFLVNSFISFFREITKLLGRGNFVKLITGKFYTPKEEYRIFMFADLKSSTTIAEKLGHLLYSSFIKDCFYDLAVVHQYGAQIYQYVGDEAVLTWEYPKMKKVSDCINAFWHFNDTLAKRSEYYQNTYGMLPYFKAGMNIGMVTVVEIGDLKKEIAYHGNAINTASRIEALCNSFNEKLLISKKLYDLLAKESSSYTYEKVTETQLRGKQGITEIYSVKRQPIISIEA